MPGVDPEDSGAAIRLGEKSKMVQAATHWGLILVVFMRFMSILWIAQGLLEWVAVLTPSRPIFELVPARVGAALIFFAIIDFVAGVGLWLASPWGGVLWLFAATSQIFVSLAIRGFFWAGWIAVDIVLIVVYFALTWQAGRPFEPTAPRRKRL